MKIPFLHLFKKIFSNDECDNCRMAKCSYDDYLVCKEEKSEYFDKTVSDDDWCYYWKDRVNTMMAQDN